jgi:predicted permease
MTQLIRRLRYLLNRRRFDQELSSDLEFHREMAAREGRAIGSTLRLREEARDAWGWTWIERLSQDLRYAARMLRKSPGFTLAAVLMLAIGIGVNVAAFGYFDLMVLRPLPVREPETLLRFQRLSPESYASVLPYPEMAFFREHSKTLSAVLAWSPSKFIIDGEEARITGHFVTGNLFTELGAVPALGRLLDPTHDDSPTAEPVVVLSHAFWQRHFAADPSIAGKTIRLNGKPATVIGVASEDFCGLSLNLNDLWLPVTQQPYFIDGSHMLTDFSVSGSSQETWGRIRPGITPKIAEAELSSLAAALRSSHPDDIWDRETFPSQPGGYATSAITTSHDGTGKPESNKAGPITALVAALALLILAVACGNLGSLLLARGVARQREIAIRVSVGAGSGRLIRQLFTESVLLGIFGSVAGLALGYAVLRGMMLMTNTPPWLNPTPDWRVMAFAVAAGFAAALLFGLTPALQLARQRQRATIMRQILLGAQVAGSCILLIVAGLLVRALNHAVTANPGFEYQQVVSIDPSLGAHGYSSAKAAAWLDALRSRLDGLPGVESISLASSPPVGNKTVVLSTGDFGGRQLDIHINRVDPQFFHTMRIPILRGRSLMRGDTQSLVVSQSMAAIAWPGQDPIGKPFPVNDLKYTVVGISGNARATALQDPDAVEAYFLAGASDQQSMIMLVKTSGSPESIAPTLTSIARAIDPRILPEVQFMRSNFDRKLQGSRYSAITASVLGSVALLLACLGIVGLVAYAVSQRTQEIGIRMALGATPAHVLSVVLRQFSTPVGIGLIIGVAAAAGLSQVLRRQLYGISNLDPIAYLAAIGIFAAIAILSAIMPARRALRINPIIALRYD